MEKTNKSNTFTEKQLCARMFLRSSYTFFSLFAYVYWLTPARIQFSFGRRSRECRCLYMCGKITYCMYWRFNLVRILYHTNIIEPQTIVAWSKWIRRMWKMLKNSFKFRCVAINKKREGIKKNWSSTHWSGLLNCFFLILFHICCNIIQTE